MSENKQIVGGSGDPREDALDALFAGSIEDSMTITDLPSKGKFYEGFNGVEIKALTYLDEQTILTAKDNNKDVIAKLLEKCIEGIDVGELLSMDKLYLLMKVRELSYGKDYSFNITCPNCNADIKSSLVISQHLNMNPVPDEMEDPREILLPKLNVKAQVRFPRGKEEVFLTSSEDVYKNLYRFVVSINDSSDPVFISKALKRMHIQDIKTLIASVNEAEYGVDPKFLFECPECGHTDTMAIPMDVGFFSVS